MDFTFTCITQLEAVNLTETLELNVFLSSKKDIVQIFIPKFDFDYFARSHPKFTISSIIY